MAIPKVNGGKRIGRTVNRAAAKIEPIADKWLVRIAKLLLRASEQLVRLAEYPHSGVVLFVAAIVALMLSPWWWQITGALRAVFQFF